MTGIHLAPAPAATPDPRPVIVGSGRGATLVGSRCDSCGYPIGEVLERCPVCGGPCRQTEFGPGATVFAATVLRVAVPGRQPPYGLAYVDVDDGPRILAHVDDASEALVPGQRVVLAGTTDDGDPLVTADDDGARR